MRDKQEMVKGCSQTNSHELNAKQLTFAGHWCAKQIPWFEGQRTKACEPANLTADMEKVREMVSAKLSRWPLAA
jgi:hypothetical protein